MTQEPLNVIFWFLNQFVIFQKKVFVDNVEITHKTRSSFVQGAAPQGQLLLKHWNLLLGGVLTLTWYMYIWGAFFTNFGIAIGGFHDRWRYPIYMNWVYFEQITVKSTQFEQNCMFLYEIDIYIDGW